MRGQPTAERTSSPRASTRTVQTSIVTPSTARAAGIVSIHHCAVRMAMGPVRTVVTTMIHTPERPVTWRIHTARSPSGRGRRGAVAGTGAVAACMTSPGTRSQATSAPIAIATIMETSRANPTSPARAASSSPRCSASVRSWIPPRNTAVPTETPAARRRVEDAWPQKWPIAQNVSARATRVPPSVATEPMTDENPSGPSVPQWVATCSGRSSRHESTTTVVTAWSASGTARVSSALRPR